jgi:hypothetical protein
VAGAFGDLVDPGLQAFNVDRLYGGDTSVDALLDAANTFPMMAERRVVLVLEAERLLIPKRESKAADEDLARLEAFIQSPSPHATVVFVCGSLDMRRRISKTLAREAQVVDCGTIEDTADAERWIKARAARDKVPLDAAAIRRAGRARRHQPGTPAGRHRAGGVVCDGAGDDFRRRREAVGPAGPDQHQDFGIATRSARETPARRSSSSTPRSRTARPRSSCWGSCASWPSARPDRACATRSAPSSGRTSPSSRAAAIRSCCSNGWWWSCAGSRAGGWAVVRRAGQAGADRCCRAAFRRPVDGPPEGGPYFGCALEAGREARLVAAGGVAVDDARLGHLVHDRHRLAQRRLGPIEILVIELGADGLQRRPQRRAHLPVVVPPLDVLPVRLEG